jgi:hypothetical protein
MRDKTMINNKATTIFAPENYEFIENKNPITSTSVLNNGGQEIMTVVLLVNKITHPHQELIDLSEQYKQDYPEFWWELFQIKVGQGWLSINPKSKEFHRREEYQKHPHTENIIKWHQCSEEEKQRWECKSIRANKWGTDIINPNWQEDVEYRLKPKKILIGEYDVPEPIRSPLKGGEEYWMIKLIANFVDCYVWVNDPFDEERLNNGLIFRTKEDAEIALNAILSVLKP